MTLLLIGVLLFTLFGLYRGYTQAKSPRQYLILASLGLFLPTLALFLFGPLLLLSPLKIGFNQIKSGNNIVIYYPSSQKEIPLSRTQEGHLQTPQLVSQTELTHLALNYTQTAIQKNEGFYQIPVKAKVLLVYGPNNLFRLGGVLKGGGTGNEFGIIVDEQFLNEKLITHELSHDAIRNLLGPLNSLKLPTWFDEGMATYIASQDHYLSPDDAKNLLTQNQFDRNLSRWEGFLGHLRWKFTDIQRHGKTYGHVYLFTKYLFDTYGENKMYDLILALKHDSFKKAFQNTLDITPDKAHEQFISNLSENSPTP